MKYGESTKKDIKGSAKRVLSLILGSVVVLTLFIFTQNGSFVVNAASADEISLNQNISDLQSRQEELKAELAELEDKESDAQDEKAYIDQLIAVTQTKINSSNELLEKLNDSISEAQEDIAEKEAEIDKTFSSFKERMVSSHEDGEISYISILLGSDDLSDLISRADRISCILEYNQDIILKYRQEKEDLESEKTELENSLALQSQTKEGLEADQAEYEELSDKSESYITELGTQKSMTQDEYQSVVDAENQLDEELTALLMRQATIDKDNDAAEAETEAETEPEATEIGRAHV